MVLGGYDAVIGYKNGMVKGVELKNNTFEYSHILGTISIGLHALDYYDKNEIMLTANRIVMIYNVKEKISTKRHAVIEQAKVVGVFRRRKSLIVGIDNGTVAIVPTRGFKKYSELVKIKTEMPISCIRRGFALDSFAVGGIDNPLKIWDLTTGQCSFASKRPKPDILQLEQPCNVSDIRFFYNNKVAVSHQHGVLDVHDPLSAQRRPVLSRRSEDGFICMQTTPGNSEYEVIVGTSKGSIIHYDFRGRSKLPVKTFRGSVGSIKSVSFINYAKEMHLMSVSLDCHVRVHNFASGDIIMQDYMALRPSALLTKIDTKENS